MKISIENKISIPFLTLFIVSLTIVLMTSFQFDYNYVMNSQFRQMDQKLKEVEVSIQLSLQDTGQPEQVKKKIIDDLRLIYPHELLVYEERVLIMGDAPILKKEDVERINRPLSDYEHLTTKAYLLTSKRLKSTGWTLVVLVDKRELMSYFYESYKYNILIGIIFLTLALQFTILVSANITKPLKVLSKFCDQISGGDYNKRIELNRKDEIGKLGEALNQMLEQLEASMTELIYVKNYNQDILNNIENGIITYDAHEAQISQNPFATMILEQLKPYTFEGDSFEKCLKTIIQRTKEQNLSQYQLYRFTHAEGDVKFIDVNTSVIRSNEESIGGYICSFKDISEQKKVESRIQRLERLASTGRLAAGVAHEIRNPLAGMRASIQVLNKRLKSELTGKNEMMFLRLIQEIDRINKLIFDLLEYAKRYKAEPKLLNLHSKLTELLDLVESELQSKQIHLSLENLKKDTLIFVDSVQFSQIVLNILKNAIEALPSETGRIVVEVVDDELNVILKIADNGLGIPRDALDKIFDPFFTTKSEGTGLGLSIVHELIVENEGEIDVRSNEGEGTEVMLTFKKGGGFING
ncbi:PAS domain-containing sensor histidine kinase [Fusibacter sp. 3D3]|uniref:sensor histidine kinase n=1 Tax=Fusibacter sp. 3D3 TaxID=1048380 RepID=UPI000853D84F|nr:ATP-binding protein [Fusibacter sp. 3D3]GAU78303.1 sensor protein of zinc sigma-54-dependent two-component system [Fusibacter sp. 3D3]